MLILLITLAAAIFLVFATLLLYNRFRLKLTWGAALKETFWDMLSVIPVP